MDRSHNCILLIFTLLLSIIPQNETAAVSSSKSGWSQTPPNKLCSLADELEPALSSFLGENITIDRIIFSFENDDVKDYHQYMIFAQVECDCEESVHYFVRAYNSWGGFTVTDVQKYEY